MQCSVIKTKASYQTENEAPENVHNTANGVAQAGVSWIDRCTFSIPSLSCFVAGETLTELYSRQGLTYILNAFIKSRLSRDTKQCKIAFARKWARNTKPPVRSVNINVLHKGSPHEFTVDKIQSHTVSAVYEMSCYTLLCDHGRKDVQTARKQNASGTILPVAEA